MLSFEGNTAPYLQYAYTRIQSIFRRAESTANTAKPQHEGHPSIGSASPVITVTSKAERHLILQVLAFDGTVLQVANDGFPHTLCTYLYELASAFMTFYEHCPILKDNVSPELRSSRLQLCQLTAGTLKKGLELLGIETMERM